MEKTLLRSSIFHASVLSIEDIVLSCGCGESQLLVVEAAAVQEKGCRKKRRARHNVKKKKRIDTFQRVSSDCIESKTGGSSPR